uniref:Retrotransposon protein, putative, Ty1-copia subclass n=1 Tax=Oryza sativa subsp. japonica TaxID=39947 RepID=Q2QW76_ORYSJ|nr:retrotransposon protein, putative, Ty1-copia subclass [Oryza sativa Japonica Group]
MEAEKIEKTLSTMLPEDRILTQQYRANNFQKHSLLIHTLTQAERHHELSLKNAQQHPPGSAPLPEVHFNVQNNAENKKGFQGNSSNNPKNLTGKRKRNNNRHKFKGRKKGKGKVGSGRAIITLPMGTQVTIEDALLYPDSTRTLLSYRDIRQNGFHIETHMDNQEEFLLLTKQNGYGKRICEKIPSLTSGLYYTYIKPIAHVAYKVIFQNVDAFHTWHDRLGHPGIGMMRKIIGNSIGHHLITDKFPKSSNFVCTACATGKLILRPSYLKTRAEPLKFLERIQGDICGPIVPRSGPFRLANNLPDAFTNYKGVTKSFIPAQNASERVEVPNKTTQLPLTKKRGRSMATQRETIANKQRKTLMDVVTTYLYGSLDSNIYMKVPDRIDIPNQKKILEKFNMDESYPSKTPMVVRSLDVEKDPFRPKEDGEDVLGPDFPYLSAIGALMYLANSTRPDIAFSVNLLARYSAAPTKRHWTGVKNVFRYLKGTRDLGLFFKKNHDSTLIRYTDAGYLSDPHNVRSQTGFVFLQGGTAISWKSSKQTLVATSTNHSEIIALYEASRECVWLRRMVNHILTSCGIGSLESPTIIYEDNAACVVQMETGYIKSNITKHIAPKLFYPHELQQHGEINILQTKSCDNLADLFTKSLPYSTFFKCVEGIGMRRLKNLRDSGGVSSSGK